MNYVDAFFKTKRGFAIIGLTGYFNSGFKKVSEILTADNKPILPGYDSLKQDGVSHHLNRRIYDKLHRIWGNHEWKQFKSIDLSAIILLFLVRDCMSGIEVAESIREAAEDLVTALAQDKDIILNLLDTRNTLYKTDPDKIICLYDRVVSNMHSVRTRFGNDYNYIIGMQTLGSNIRRYGKSCPLKEDNPNPEFLFIIPEIARRVIKSYRLNNFSYFVIKSFKNPYEIEYFKRRYYEFYLVGTLTDTNSRRRGSLSSTEFEKIDRREKNIRESADSNDISEILSFVNVTDCLQKVDYFINTEPSVDVRVSYNTIKLLSLINNPGCLPPTDDERGMQFAMTARQMSRCLSRQVGAAIVDSSKYVVGIGWNDPPEGQVPCSLRTAGELISGDDAKAFSEFERSPEFKKHIRENCSQEYPFCFRHELPRMLKVQDKMSEYTRALHAEENAFFQASWNKSGKITGGTLYVTDCTCNLCAKKAYQLGIERILYVDEYPGYSIQQTLKTGDRAISINHFEGVTADAYFKLYTPLLPEKNLIQMQREGK